MKKTVKLASLGLLLLLLSGCMGAPDVSVIPEHTTAPSSVSTTDSTLEPEPPEPTGLVLEDPFEVFRSPETILVYPHSREDLQQARDIAVAAAKSISAEPGILTFHTDVLEFDPILTDIKVRQYMAAQQIPGWTEEEYYRHLISFTLQYSAEYDHTQTFLRDADHRTIGIHLFRQNVGDEWSLRDMGNPVSDYSGFLTDPILPKNGSADPGRILAVYGPMNGQYWVYQEDTKLNMVTLQKYNPEETDLPNSDPAQTEPAPVERPVLRESVHQTGEPISPQPGDTSASWNPLKAADFPSDSDCSDGEFLEKWMSVEGLTFQDLEERNCSQLVVVSAQETDGVETLTTCYQKQLGGTWAAVDGLTGMHGHTGTNGIAHDRRRNTVTSPAGLWKLGTAFGNAPCPDHLKIPWRQITPQSDWVCDANSMYFNTWQERDDPNLLERWDYGDVEHLEDYPNAYSYACVIEFNTAPYTIPDRGCAIFFHCSRGATGGCIGLGQDDLINVLQWMNAGRNPCILISGYQQNTPEN